MNFKMDLIDKIVLLSFAIIFILFIYSIITIGYCKAVNQDMLNRIEILENHVAELESYIQGTGK